MMDFQAEFEKKGLTNIILKKEKDSVHLRTNVFNEEQVLRWKEVYCKCNKITLNCLRTHSVANKKLHFRRKYMCLHGQSRSLGKKKDFTG